MTMIICSLILVLFLVFTKGLINLFVDSNNSGLVITVGSQFLKTVAPFYLIVGAKIVCDGVLRGAGAMKEFMLGTFTDLILRVILSYVLAYFIGYPGIWISYPLGWIVGTASSIYFYYKGTWIRN